MAEKTGKRLDVYKGGLIPQVVYYNENNEIEDRSDLFGFSIIENSENNGKTSLYNKSTGEIILFNVATGESEKLARVTDKKGDAISKESRKIMKSQDPTDGVILDSFENDILIFREDKLFLVSSENGESSMTDISTVLNIQFNDLRKNHGFDKIYKNPDDSASTTIPMWVGIINSQRKKMVVNEATEATEVEMTDAQKDKRNLLESLFAFSDAIKNPSSTNEQIIEAIGKVTGIGIVDNASPAATTENLNTKLDLLNTTFEGLFVGDQLENIKSFFTAFTASSSREDANEFATLLKFNKEANNLQELIAVYNENLGADKQGKLKAAIASYNSAITTLGITEDKKMIKNPKFGKKDELNKLTIDTIKNRIELGIKAVSADPTTPITPIFNTLSEAKTDIISLKEKPSALMIVANDLVKKKDKVLDKTETIKAVDAYIVQLDNKKLFKTEKKEVAGKTVKIRPGVESLNNVLFAVVDVVTNLENIDNKEMTNFKMSNTYEIYNKAIKIYEKKMVEYKAEKISAMERMKNAVTKKIKPIIEAIKKIMPKTRAGVNALLEENKEEVKELPEGSAVGLTAKKRK